MFVFLKREELERDAQEALNIIKTVVGVKDFPTHYALVQSALLKKKIKRKREKAQEVSHFLKKAYKVHWLTNLILFQNSVHLKAIVY